MNRGRTRERSFRCAAFCVGALFAATAVGDEPQPQPKPSPEIVHESRRIEGWRIDVDARLLAKPHRKTGRDALRILANQLHRIARVLPAERVADLREVPIRLDLDHPLGNLQYHPSVEWLRKNGHDPTLAKCVHVPRADRLIRLYDENSQPWVVLHELAHAYHDRVLGFEYAPIRAAWDDVVAEKQLESVLHLQGGKRRHYALTNAKEYFAEMTEAFFGTNDFHPFVRAELQEVSPRTATLLKEIWLEGAGRPQAETKR